MKFFLASYLLPDPKKFAQFIGKPADGLRLGLILNAKDYLSDTDRRARLGRAIEYFSDFGFNVEPIDLRDFSSADKLKEKLMQFDALWFHGGNIFCLRSALQESGCEEILEDVLESGVVYGGDSADTIVAGPTLNHFESISNLNETNKELRNGLGLVDFSIIPHWDSDDYADFKYDLKDNLENDGIETIPLKNDEYVLVGGGEITYQP